MRKKREELVKIKNDLETFVAEYCSAFPGKSDDYVSENCQEAMSMIQDTVHRIDEEIDEEEKG